MKAEASSLKKDIESFKEEREEFISLPEVYFDGRMLKVSPASFEGKGYNFIEITMLTFEEILQEVIKRVILFSPFLQKYSDKIYSRNSMTARHGAMVVWESLIAHYQS